jgi:hypothetical protein
VSLVPNAPRRLLLPAVLLAALALGGCGGFSSLGDLRVTDLNPLKGDDPLRTSDYNYFYRRDAVANAGQVAAAELVGPDGRCAFAPAPSLGGGEPVASAPPAPPAQDPVNQPINPQSNSALYFTAGPQAGPATGGPGSGQLPPEVRGAGPRGIALSMTECQVVSVAGYTDRVAISASPRGERLVTLTYPGGDRPGIYYFRNGRLFNMERVAEPAQPKKPPRATKTAKKQAKQPKQQ